MILKLWGWLFPKQVVCEDRTCSRLGLAVMSAAVQVERREKMKLLKGNDK